jgi:hypothetical protein
LDCAQYNINTQALIPVGPKKPTGIARKLTGAAHKKLIEQHLHIERTHLYAAAGMSAK